jgi:hypothetical protein
MQLLSSRNCESCFIDLHLQPMKSTIDLLLSVNPLETEHPAKFQLHPPLEGKFPEHAHLHRSNHSFAHVRTSHDI